MTSEQASFPAPTIELQVVRFLTCLADETPLAAVDQWRSQESAGEFRRASIVHDAISLLWQSDVDGTHDLETAAAAAVRIRQAQRLTPEIVVRGETQCLVVKTDHPVGVGPRLLAAMSADRLEPIVGGPWIPGVQLFRGAAAGLLVMVAGSDDETDRRLGEVLYGNFRLAETMAHKIQLQFAEYERRFQSPLLTAANRLGQQLELLAEALEDPHPDSTDAVRRSLRTMNATVAAFSRGVQAVSSVRQIRTMLAANLQNLRTVPGADAERGEGKGVLQQRIEGVARCVAQVDADLGLMDPLLEAGQWLGQVQQGRLLASLGVSEARENQQRDRDQQRTDWQSLLVGMIGLWIGIGAIWSAVVSSQSGPDGVKWDHFLRALSWHLSVPIAGLLLIVVVAVMRRPRSSPRTG